jgi:hypothetical protein
VGTFFSTVSAVFGQTEHTFLTMRRRAGYGPPMGFAIVGFLIGGTANTVYQTLLEATANGQDPAFLAARFCGVLICIPVVVIVLLYLSSFAHHLMLMLVDGTPGFHEFETTFRVIAYCGGSGALLSLIPVCGACIQLIVVLVLTVIGLAAAHETSMGKAAAAVVVPLMFCMVAGFGLVMVVVAALGMAA